jgi:anti-sigma regulatory factor (Ser/Thr protein kinase)
VAAIDGSIEIPNSLDQLSGVRKWLKDGMDEANFPSALANQVMVAVDEAVSNVIEHAFPDIKPGTGQVRIRQVVSEDSFRIELEDDGMRNYDPRTAANVLIEEHVAAGKRGGLGIFLMRRIMDVVDYHSEAGRFNRLTLIKYVD